MYIHTHTLVRMCGGEGGGGLQGVRADLRVCMCLCACVSVCGPMCLCVCVHAPVCLCFCIRSPVH